MHIVILEMIILIAIIFNCKLILQVRFWSTVLMNCIAK